MGALIIGAAIYFALKRETAEPSQPADVSSVATSTAQCLAPAEALVTKIIDGDTIVVEGGWHVRVLSIDADERGHACCEPASQRLEELVLNKKVRLEKDISDVDQYKRCLRYVFLPADVETLAGEGQKDIGLQLVKEGLAIARFYEPDVRYKQEITLAEKTAIDNKVGCKWAGLKSSAEK